LKISQHFGAYRINAFWLPSLKNAKQCLLKTRPVLLMNSLAVWRCFSRKVNAIWKQYFAPQVFLRQVNVNILPSPSLKYFCYRFEGVFIDKYFLSGFKALINKQSPGFFFIDKQMYTPLKISFYFIGIFILF